MHKRLPVVVLAGRPNVGKSTLFNRISGARRAIVSPVPGTTRDVITQPVVWGERRFELTDTGGMFGASADPLRELVVARGRRALETADVIVFVVDGREGLVAADEEIARDVRRAGVPVIVAVNKIDDRRARHGALEFFQLGFDTVREISAEHGQGIEELLEPVIDGLEERSREGRAKTTRSRAASSEPVALPVDGRAPGVRRGRSRRSARTVERSVGEADREAVAEIDARPEEVGVVFIGRPNVGKSSLVNRLLREELALVSEMPGTTRDAVDGVLRWHRRQFRIVDTAGIRRPGRVARAGQIEAVSVIVARRAIGQADIAVVVLDATEGATDQDAAIAGEADRAGRGIIVVANKWDLAKGRSADVAKAFDEEVRRRLKFLDYAPLLHVSAATGERTGKLLETIDRIAAARRRRVPTPELNRFIQAVTAIHPPASPGRKQVRILYAAQIGVAPPSFVFFTNVATTFHFSYERFLVNRLREAFGFVGTPIRVQVRRRGGGK